MRARVNTLPALRRVLLVMLFLCAAVLQNTFLAGTKAPLLPLVPLTAAVCAFEHEFAGVFFGFLGGALYDIASTAAPDGVYALEFAAVGAAVGLLMHYVFRRTLFSVYLLTLAFTFLTALTGFTFSAVTDPGIGLSVFFSRFVPGAFFTSLFLPAAFYPVRFLEEKLR